MASTRDEETGLLPRQVTFAREYMVDENATQAYIRAGYEPENADSNATRLMGNDRVKALIARMRADRARRLEIDADRVLAQIARLAFGDVRKVFHAGHSLRGVNDLDDDTAAAVQSVKVVTRPGGVDEEGNRVVEEVIEYKMADKRGPLSDLAKHLGELKEHHKHEVDEEALEILGWLNDRYGPGER